MPKMKYFQQLADIREDYYVLLRAIDDKEGKSLFSKYEMENWGVDYGDKEDLLEEVNVLKYLSACQYGIAHHEVHNLQKPTKEAVNRCFNRYIKRLEDIFNVNDFNINKHDNPIVKKKYKACRHYLFKFSLNGWVRSLPDEIETFANKYGN